MLLCSCEIAIRQNRGVEMSRGEVDPGEVILQLGFGIETTVCFFWQLSQRSGCKVRHCRDDEVGMTE